MANTTKKFLDSSGTTYLWSKIKTKLNEKANADDVADIKTKLGTLKSGQQTFAAWITGAENEIDVLQALHVNGKTVAQEVAAGISDLNLSNTYAEKAYEGKVNTLIGSDANKSVRAIANEELVAQLIPASAKQSLDTLAEIADWIQNHPADAAAMNTAITDNTEAITILNGNSTTAGSVAKAIADEVTRANVAYDSKGSAAAVLGASTDTSTVVTVYGVKAYAKSYADGLAANCATAEQGTKADSALQADDVIALTNGEIDDAIASAT